MTRRLVSMCVGVALLLSTTVVANAQDAPSAQTPQSALAPEGVDPDVPPARVRDGSGEVEYLPAPWELDGSPLPALDMDAVDAVEVDDDAQRFSIVNELGGFLPTPKGGSALFGSGQPLFGVAAPSVGPDGRLPVLGSGPTGGRFLGERPPFDQQARLPVIVERIDGRIAYGYIDGLPTIPDDPEDGSTPFPLDGTLLADPVRGRPDNLKPEPLTTTTTTTTPVPTRTTTSAPRTDAARTTSTTTAPPRQGTPRVRRTTTTTRPTTTTVSRPETSTTTTSTTTTTTTRPTTTTTQPSSTTTTTLPPIVLPPPPAAGSTFVLGNTKDAGTTCLSNGPGSNLNANQCDRLFDIAGARPGVPYSVDVTLWNVDPDSDTDAIDLRVYSQTGCINGTVGAPPYGSNANLCGGVELTIQRYSDAARTVPSLCVFGGSGTTCSSPGRLDGFASAHTSMANGAQVDNDFRVNERAYLRVTVRLPDRGFDPSGRGRDNEFMKRSASIGFTWRMDSA